MSLLVRNRMDDETVQLDLFGEAADLIDDGETVYSAYEAGNSEVFPKILGLHVEKGSEIADVTYGKGVFWKNVPSDLYDTTLTDIDPEKSPDSDGGVDCRDLPYEDGEFDCVVLDPPYASGFYRDNSDSQLGHDSHESFRDSYTSKHTGSSSKYHQAVLDVYYQAGQEAKRVLRDGGTFIVKVQDEVSANTQHLTHIEITEMYTDIGFTSRDLFVVVRQNNPSMTGVDTQVHARKNHSYFMVYDS